MYITIIYVSHYNADLFEVWFINKATQFDENEIWNSTKRFPSQASFRTGDEEELLRRLILLIIVSCN